MIRSPKNINVNNIALDIFEKMHTYIQQPEFKKLPKSEQDKYTVNQLLSLINNTNLPTQQQDQLELLIIQKSVEELNIGANNILESHFIQKGINEFFRSDANYTNEQLTKIRNTLNNIIPFVNELYQNGNYTTLSHKIENLLQQIENPNNNYTPKQKEIVINASSKIKYSIYALGNNTQTTQQTLKPDTIEQVKKREGIKTVPLPTQGSQNISPRHTVIQSLIEKRHNEKRQLYYIRYIFTIKAGKLFKNINPLTAATLGELAAKKIMYNLTYPQDIENILIHMLST